MQYQQEIKIQEVDVDDNNICECIDLRVFYVFTQICEYDCNVIKRRKNNKKK